MALKAPSEDSVMPTTWVDPVSSGEIQSLDLDRADQVERRHRLLAELLELTGHDALLIEAPENFAWLSCGGENTRHGTSETIAALFVTQEARVVVCNAVDGGQLFDRELNGLGFQLKERSWEEPRDVLIRDVCRGRNVAADRPRDGLPCVAEQLADFRLRLVQREWDMLRQLGRATTHAVEATARTFERGHTESEVAGQLSHRLLRHGITPARIQVMADGQGHRYRHWGFGADEIERHCVLSVLARRGGLHVGLTRTVCFGQPPDTMLNAHQLACLVLGTGIFFSKPGWEGAETWNRVRRIYEKFGAGEEWRCADQAEVVGYAPCESSVSSRCSHRFQAGEAVFWHPSVGAAVAGDTVLIRDTGCESLTRAEDWPLLGVRVKGTTIDLPDVLCREA